MRFGSACSALVEQDDAVLLRVVEATHIVAAAAARPTMNHHYRLAPRIAALLVVQTVALIDLQIAVVVGLHCGMQNSTFHQCFTPDFVCGLDTHHYRR